MTSSAKREIDVALPRGEVTVSAHLEVPADPWAALALAHGAGGGPEHPFLGGFARALGAHGIATLRFAFPYREAGRRLPGPASHAVATWAAVAAALQGWHPDLSFWAAGKSYGGRMASLAAAEGVIAPRGLVYLGYPLHPPGDPDTERGAHLPDIREPQLFVSGTADPFVQPVAALERWVAACRDAEIEWVEDAGHSFEGKGSRRSAEEIGADLAAPVARWMRARDARQRPEA